MEARTCGRCVSVVLTLASCLLAGACDWPWPMEHSLDVKRCEWECDVGEVCMDGQCTRLGKVLKAGTFLMGAPANGPCAATTGDMTLHSVTLTRPFEILTTEVTHELHRAAMGYDRSVFQGIQQYGPSHPVADATWYEAAAFCNALSDAAGLTPCYACAGQGANSSCSEASGYAGSNIFACPGFRLPSEAEWEYAYRAGTKTGLYNGEVTKCQGVDPRAEVIAWYKGNSSSSLHAVGQKKPNAWGLYDMAGNVAEWVHDGWTADLGAAKKTNPVTGTVPAVAAKLVRRGGSVKKSPGALRGAFRTFFTHSAIAWDQGFRCVRTAK